MQLPRRRRPPRCRPPRKAGGEDRAERQLFAKRPAARRRGSLRIRTPPDLLNTSPPMTHVSPSRRRFLQRAAAAGVAPFFVPRRSWSQDAAPGKKLVMGMIGMGKQMGGLMSKFLQYPDVQVVAVCD